MKRPEDLFERMSLFRHRNTLAAIGSAALFVSQEPPFSDFKLGPWMDTFKGQILRNHYFFTEMNGQIVGYCGWALVSHESAKDWIENRRTLNYEECLDGPVVIVLANRTTEKEVQRLHTYVMRAIHADREVTYWKRVTSQGTRLLRFDLQNQGIQRTSDPIPIKVIG